MRKTVCVCVCVCKHFYACMRYPSPPVRRVGCELLNVCGNTADVVVVTVVPSQCVCHHYSHPAEIGIPRTQIHIIYVNTCTLQETAEGFTNTLIFVMPVLTVNLTGN